MHTFALALISTGNPSSVLACDADGLFGNHRFNPFAAKGMSLAPGPGRLEPGPVEQWRRVDNFDRAKTNRNVSSEADAPRPRETGPSAPVTRCGSLPRLPH